MRTNFTEKPDRRRHLARLRLRWIDAIKMELEVRRYESVGCVHVTQDLDQWRSDVSTVMGLRSVLKLCNLYSVS